MKIFFYTILAFTTILTSAYILLKKDHKIEEGLKSISLVIPSCDKYSELWEIHFQQLFKFWPSLEKNNQFIPLILISNFKEYKYPRVINFKVGEDKSWSDNILKVLNTINTKYVLILLEDYILTEAVNENRLIDILKLMENTNAAYAEITVDEGMFIFGFETEKNYVPNIEGVIYRSQDGLYRNSLQTCIWNVKDLKKLLRRGESAWDFEIIGNARTQKIRKPFYMLTKTPVFSYLNAADKGKYNPDFINYLKKQNIDFNPINIPIK